MNLVLNRIPDKPIFNFSAQTSYNTQVTNEQGFLSYRGGGVERWASRPRAANSGAWGELVGRRGGLAVQRPRTKLAPPSAAAGLDGVEVGGFLSLFYEKDSSFFDNEVTTAGGSTTWLGLG